MNISSVIVSVAPEYFQTVLAVLEGSDFCELHFTDENHRMIVTIEGEDTQQETAKLRQLQLIPHVISAEMVYAYSEEELTALRDQVEDTQGVVPQYLADDSARAEDAEYGGDINRQLNAPT